MSSHSASVEEKSPFVLPPHTTPLHYDLLLTPDLVHFTFSGRVRIAVHVNSATDSIELNAYDLEVQSAVIEQAGASAPAASITINKQKERVELKFSSPVAVGDAVLALAFTGTLNDMLCGFYRSSYQIEGESEKRYMATTQFEAADARRAFPCWDEPARKATFSVSLTVPSELEALGNMPVATTTDNGDGTKTVAFDKTPKMSTYLLAWCVGRFEYIEGRTSDGVVVRVYTTPGKSHLGKFALAVAEQSIPYFHDYFDIGYPLTKMDMIAVPDFSAGAMENWYAAAGDASVPNRIVMRAIDLAGGLVTYREVAVLIDEKMSSADRKARVAETVAHEIAHQWFGNLVTMEWWNNLWLNEGFATWVSFLAMNKLFPEWNVWELFLTANMASAFGLDSLTTSHPVEVPVGEARSIDEIFDNISYAKGSCMLRMISAFLGEEAFRDGLRLYLQRHKYANTQTEDLWRALEEKSGQPVTAIMNSWTKQTGYPVVTVAIDGANLVLKQQRFLDDGTTDDTLWQVPVKIAFGDGSHMSVVFGAREGSFALTPAQAASWIKVNAEQTAFYRVQYTGELFARLEGAIERKELGSMDRFGLVNDAFSVARSGRGSVVDVARLLRRFVDDESFIVWNEMCTVLNTILVVFSGESFVPKLQAYTRDILASVAARVGWDGKDGESHQIKLLRGMVLETQLYANDSAMIAEARKRFEKPDELHADLRKVCYGAMLVSGGEAEYEKLLAMYRATELQEEKVRLLRSLGYARDTAVLAKVLDFALHSGEVRLQDLVFVVGGAAANPMCGNVVWSFVKQHFDELRKAYGGGGYLFGHILASAVRSVISDVHLADVHEFFAGDRMGPSYQMTVAQAKEKVGLNVKWIARDAAALHAFFAA